jgi:hypothetical protein
VYIKYSVSVENSAMKAYNKKGLTTGSIAEKSTKTYIVSKHDFAPRIPTITKGLKLTGLTHVARTNQNSQVSPLSKNLDYAP